MRPVAIFAAYVILLACPVSALTKQYRTYVDPGPAETMQGPCEYELTLRDANKPVKAVFVVVERGWQVGNLYFDPEVTAFAERHDVALVLARHCRSKTEKDMDIIPEHGIGPALLEALNQFARQSQHPELAGSKLILFSFSGGGGTRRPYSYFEKYRNSAPLTFMVQNRVPHCCVMNVMPVVLLWLDDLFNEGRPAADEPLAAIEKKHSWEGFIKTEDSRVKAWNEPVWNVTDAWIEPFGSATPKGSQDAGWLPSKRFAQAWLAFEKAQEHPITPLE